MFARVSVAFALNAAIVGDWSETVPTFLPALMKFTHQGVVLPVPADSRHLNAVFDVPDAVEGVVIDDALDEVVKRLYVRDRDSEIPDSG